MDLKHLLLDSLGLNNREFEGKVAVITGAGRGIGREVARAFALLGGRVVIAELSEQGRSVEEEIGHAGGQALYIQTDVSRADDVRRLADAVQTTFGKIDVLVNNAIRSPVVPVAEMDETTWDQVISVNLRGTFLTCKAFLPAMLAQGSGTIINMVSTDAMPGLAAYIASKQGIAGFSQSLALEVGESGVHVIPFGPGMVDTPGIREVSETLAPRLGMSRDQFMGLSLHAAYDGLMPVEHAAVATVYLALRLAKTYHGQPVNGYEVLEQAGLIQATHIEIQGDHPEPGQTIDAQPENMKKNGRDEALRLGGEVAEIVLETAQEFEKIPAFVRPLARGGFKGKAGASLEEWQRTLANIEPYLQAGKAADLAERLEKLIQYYEGVPGETARFTRDQGMLRQVADLCRQRIACIRALIITLRSL